jgi:Cyclic nucleotide-binding domain
VAFLYPPQYFHLLKPSIRPKNWAVYLDKCEIAFFSYFNKKDMAIQVDAYPDILLEDVVETRGYEQQIIKYVSQFVQLSPVEIQAIIENLYVRTFKKGATLLREGQYSPLCYFILKGCVRKYYLVDGEEKTTHFYTEGEPISSYQGTFKRAPAKFYLSCVEDTIVSVGIPEDEKAFLQKFPKLKRFAESRPKKKLVKAKKQSLHSSSIAPKNAI